MVSLFIDLQLGRVFFISIGQPYQVTIPGDEDKYFLLGNLDKIADIGEEVNYDIQTQ